MLLRWWFSGCYGVLQDLGFVGLIVSVLIGWLVVVILRFRFDRFGLLVVFVLYDIAVTGMGFLLLWVWVLCWRVYLLSDFLWAGIICLFAICVGMCYSSYVL